MLRVLGKNGAPFLGQKGVLDLSDEVRILYKNKFSFRLFAHQKFLYSRTNLLRLPFCLPPTSVLLLQYNRVSMVLGGSRSGQE